MLFPTGGASELGYANAALGVALLRALTNRGILTESEAENVLRDGINLLSPSKHINSVQGAIALLETGLPPILKG